MRRLLVLWAFCGPVALGGEPIKVDSFPADNGFIDDPFGFSDDGRTLAYIVTDGAAKSQLRIVTPGSPDGRVSLPYPSVTPEKLFFLDAERILIVEKNPSTKLARGQVFTRQGPTHEKLGPASDIVLAKVGATPAVVTFTSTAARRGAAYTIAAYRRDNLKPLGRRVLGEGADGRIAIAGTSVELLYFLDGYTELVGKKEGEFDAAHDIRKPSLEAHFDVLGGKLTGEREIKDLVAWTQGVEARKHHPNEADFVQFNEDYKRLQLYRRQGDMVDLATPHPLGKYDPQTIAYQPLDDAVLALSLTVDPVNPEAVAAKKTDKDWLDLYRLDIASKALTEVARLDGERRSSSWRLRGTRIGVLRKHKGFARGGVELEVYDLPMK